MKYNFDEYIDRTNNHAAKYDERVKNFGTNDVIPLWIADMDFRAAQPLIDALKARAEEGVWGYTSRPASYFEAVKNWQKKRNGWEPDTSLMSWSVGVMPAIASMLKVYLKPGDKVLLQTPVYGDFFDAIAGSHYQAVENKLIEQNGVWSVDWPDFEQKLDDVQAFLLCNPHNPLGKVWEKEELDRMVKLCIKHHVLLISDEIHSDLIFHGKKHINTANTSPEAAKYVITGTSATKTFNLAGLQAATIIFPNQQLKKQFDDFWLGMDMHRNNAFSLIANEVAFTQCEDWLEQLLPYLAANFDYIDSFLKEHIPQIKAIVPDATYLVWLDCRGLQMNQQQLNDFMIHKAHLGLSDGKYFSPSVEGFMRLNAACPRSTLEKAMQQLKAAVETLQ